MKLFFYIFLIAFLSERKSLPFLFSFLKTMCFALSIRAEKRKEVPCLVLLHLFSLKQSFLHFSVFLSLLEVPLYCASLLLISNIVLFCISFFDAFVKLCHYMCVCSFPPFNPIKKRVFYFHIARYLLQDSSPLSTEVPFHEFEMRNSFIQRRSKTYIFSSLTSLDVLQSSFKALFQSTRNI